MSSFLQKFYMNNQSSQKMPQVFFNSKKIKNFVFSCDGYFTFILLPLTICIHYSFYDQVKRESRYHKLNCDCYFCDKRCN